MAQMDNSAAEQLIFGNNQGAQPAEIKTFDKPAVSDLLTIDHSLSVFYDYVRQSGPLVRGIQFVLALKLASLPCCAVNSRGEAEHASFTFF